MLKKVCLSCVLLCLTAPRLSAQLPKASEYFPLEVGNVWEYELYWDGSYSPYLRHKVIADTVIGDTARVYTIVIQTILGTDSSWQDQTYYSYAYNSDSSAVYEVGSFESIDSAYEPGMFPFIGISREDLDGTYKLLDTSHGFNWVWEHAEADYGESLAITDTGTVELFGKNRYFLDVNFVDESGDTLAILWFDTQYILDIGRSRLQYEGDLTYAKVGGVEYGAPLITGVHSPAFRQNVTEKRVLCYPNPAKYSAALIFPFTKPMRFDVYIMNSLGQTIRSFVHVRQNKLHWDCRDNSGKFVPNGVYFIRAEGGQRNLNGKILVLR
ncbi:T9SS type A sorting domain-containing protein [candidate division KSB1 bacterium]|nr:T9SS type A sorting domain-containing protein [candidate division KSB1 bacterium]